MRRHLGIAVLVACALSGPGSIARAFPQLALRPGGTPFEGPTDPEVTSLWWNPAAISQLRGLHLLGDAQLLLQRGNVSRAAICSATGLPCSSADRAFPDASLADTSWSGFGGITWDFRQENLSIGFGVFLPWEKHRSFTGADGAAAGSSELSTAYHLRSEDYATRYYAVGLGVKLSQKLAIGVSLAVAEASAKVRFDRDTALDGGSAAVQQAGGYEQAAAASRVTAYGDGGTFWKYIPSPSGLALSVGVLYQPIDGLYLGGSWSRMFPFYGVGGRFALSRDVGTEVQPAVGQGGPCTGPGGVCLGGATLVFDIPDVWQLGARWMLPRELELSAWARVVVYGPYNRRLASDEAVVIELSGAPVERGVSPTRLVLGRALQPTFAGELGLRWWALPRAVGRAVALRLGASLIVETSAVPSEYVSAAAMDAPKLDAMVGAELRLRWLRVVLGYQLTSLFFSSVSGVFDPGAATRCADARYALDACADALAGRALPANAGSYSLISHRLSVALGIDY